MVYRARRHVVRQSAVVAGGFGTAHKVGLWRVVQHWDWRIRVWRGMDAGEVERFAVREQLRVATISQAR